MPFLRCIYLEGNQFVDVKVLKGHIGIYQVLYSINSFLEGLASGEQCYSSVAHRGVVKEEKGTNCER